MTDEQQPGEHGTDWTREFSRGISAAWWTLVAGGVLLVLGELLGYRYGLQAALVLCWIATLTAGLIAILMIIAMVATRDLGSHLWNLMRALATGGLAFAVGVVAYVMQHGVGIGVAHGRPLRVRGRVVRAEVTADAAWARGAGPDCSDMSPETCAALAGLWRRDAQAEHASVPAFSRIATGLAGLGAPPELLLGAHAAAMQEVAHAMGCFALVAGYSGAAEGPRAMPALLQAGAEEVTLTTMALESLRDGCLLEGFSADVAARACEGATDPAVRGLLATITRDEAEHAELAWRILEWCVARGGAEVRAAVIAAARSLPADGPHAYGLAEARLVAAADPEALVRHGRVPAEAWPEIYRTRVTATRTRVARTIGDVGIAA